MSENTRPISATRRSRRRRLAGATVASFAALNLGGCGIELLGIVGTLTSLAGLDVSSWFETTPDYETAQQNAPLPKVNPTSGAMVRIAEASRARGDYLSAATFYQRAAAMDPNNASILSGLGQAMLEAGDPERATVAFQAALAIDAGNRDALHGLGNALIMQDRPEQAAAQFRAANAISHESRTYNGLGVALDMSSQHDLAQAVYRQGLRLDPQNLSLRNNIGLSLALAGDYDESVRVLRSVAALPTATARERQNLALAYGLSGDKEMAERIARIDLPEAQVASNLVAYDWLRTQPQTARTVMLGKAPEPAPEAGDETAPKEGLASLPADTIEKVTANASDIVVSETTTR